jgi:YHS domain-containing protein
LRDKPRCGVLSSVTDIDIRTREQPIMKPLKHLTVIALAVCAFALTRAGLAEDTKPEAKAKPYTLKTCIISGDKLGEMGEAYSFVYKGREIKLCCKSCLKDFNKEPAKYVKKIEEAEKKAKGKTAPSTAPSTPATPHSGA